MSESGLGHQMNRLMGRFRIRTKVVVFFLLISLASVTAVALVVNIQTRRILTDAAGADLKGLATNEAVAAGNLLLHQINLLESLSLNEILINRVTLANSLYQDDLAVVQAELAAKDAEWRTAVTTDRLAQIVLTNTAADELWAFRSRFPDHAEIFITDRYGGLLAATSMTSDYYQADEAWWQAAYDGGNGRAVIEAPQFDESSQVVGLALAVPLYARDEPTVIGILRTTYDLRALGNLLEVAAMEKDLLFLDLLLPNNRLISPRALLSSEYRMGLETAVTLDEDTVNNLKTNTSARINIDERDYLASIAPITTIDASPLINSLEWRILARQDRQIALAPVATQQRIIWLLALVIMGLAAASAIFAARYLTQPILHLTNVAQQIRDGNIDIQAPADTSDEIGELAVTFNAMTSRLRHVIARLEENRAQLEQRVAERTAELEQQTKMLDVILSTAPSYFFVYNQLGRCVYASPPALAAMGCTMEQFTGEDGQMLPPFMPERFPMELTWVFQTGQALTGEYQLTDSQKIKQYEYALNPVLGSEDSVLSIVVTVRDVTEQRLAQETLWRSQKMESLGILAGGVAHDFNNLLVALIGQTSVALYKLPEEAPARKHIEKAMKAAERAADLTKQMLAYSGKGRFAMQPIRLNQLIWENSHLFEAVIPKKVQLQLKLADQLPLLNGDPGQMQQVVMNLILNAAEAIGEGVGQVVVSTFVQTVSNSDIRYWQKTQEPLVPGAYICLKVQDDGPGMDDETLTRIFDPFFTTKFTGRGLGLAAVLGIIRGHKGGLDVVSQPGVGTTFELVFPVSAEETAVFQETAVLSNRSPISGALLVIDDEAPVREAVIDILGIEDIFVFAAANGEAGIELYRENIAAIELILLDLSMPGMSGYETFQVLKQINPQAKIVLSSGYSAEEVYRQFADEDVTDFLAKPYKLDVLVQKVQAHLG